MFSAAKNPPPSQSTASQTQTAPPTKPTPHGHPRSSEKPRQRRRLDPEDDRTVVATPVAESGSGSGLLRVPKDICDDDIGSVYSLSSDNDDGDDGDDIPVPSKRSRRSARPRVNAVRESHSPPRHKTRRRSPGPVSEGPAPSQSRGSNGRVVMVCVPKRVKPGDRRVSKRPAKSNIPSSQKKPAHRSPSGDARLDLAERMKAYQHHFSVHSHRHQQAVVSDHTRTTPASASVVRSPLTHPEPQVTGAGSAKPHDDNDSAAMMQFLADIGLGQSHFQILVQEGIRTQDDLNDLRTLETDSIVELSDVLRARGFTAFEFSRVAYAVSRKKD